MTRRAPELRLFGDNDMVVDLFAGGGGASVGIEWALGRSPDIAINHDAEAISMHRVNHPGTKHYVEDVWKANPRKLVGRKRVRLMWLSPDCKHFSKAKGAKPVEKKIRSLAWVAVYWAKQVKPDVICLENVEEFQKWGPLIPKLDERGMPEYGANGQQLMVPCPARIGVTFRLFKRRLEILGYKVEHRELIAADYGAPTTRKRLFLIARCDGKAIAWPTKTHDQHGRGGLPRWLPAADCIDWSHPCPSIFSRKKALAENTQRRIARGIERFVKKDPFIVPVMHGPEARTWSLDEPMRTITGAHRGDRALVVPHLSPYYGGGKDRAHSVKEPLRTLCCDPRFALVTPFVARIGQQGGNGDYVNTVDDPLTTVTTKAEHLLVGAALVRTAHGERDAGGKKRGKGEHQLGLPLPTVTGSNDYALMASFLKPRYGERVGQDPRVRSLKDAMPTVVPTANGGDLVAAFLAKQNGVDEKMVVGQTVNDPAHTITARDQKALVASSLVKLRGTCAHGQSVTQPLATISAQGNHFAEVRAFLMKYHRDGGQLAGLKDPMPTVLTNDSIALATVTVEGEEYAIVDIGMRMLQPRELYRAHRFPESYIIDKGADGEAMTKEAQVRMVGNSVPPDLAASIIRSQFGLHDEQAAPVEAVA